MGYKSLAISLFLCFILMGWKGKAQSFQPLNQNVPVEYYLQVKQFSEFIDRFNYISDWKGNVIDSSFQRKFPRNVYLDLLFDLHDKRLYNRDDSSFQNLQKEFITYITKKDSSRSINLYSGTVIAEASTNILYHGQGKQITLFLMPEVLEDRSAKWSLYKVEAECFSDIRDSMRYNFIPPNSNETSFINFKRMNSVSNPVYYASSGIATDPTLIFLTEVAGRRLVVKSIDKIKYQVIFPEWICTVEEFNRTDYNSGWLISDIRKLSMSAKQYLEGKRH